MTSERTAQLSVVEPLLHMANNHHAIKDCDAMVEAAETIQQLYEALEYVWTHVELEGEVGAIVDAARRKARGGKP